jgi:hypothetical protein
MDGSTNTKPVIHSEAGAILQNVTLLLMVLVASGGAIGQSAQTPALTNIVLLPGYVKLARALWTLPSLNHLKQHGLVIPYDIGPTAGRYDTDPRWNRCSMANRASPQWQARGMHLYRIERATNVFREFSHFMPRFVLSATWLICYSWC